MMNRGKLEHILEYARQQKQFGSPTCRIPPGDMVEIMERLLAQPVSSGYKLNSPETPDGWIACNERMPENGEEVIFTSRGRVLAGHFDDGSRLKKPVAKWYWLGSLYRFEVTHWMPLPAAPQPE